MLRLTDDGFRLGGEFGWASFAASSACEIVRIGFGDENSGGGRSGSVFVAGSETTGSGVTGTAVLPSEGGLLCVSAGVLGVGEMASEAVVLSKVVTDSGAASRLALFGSEVSEVLRSAGC